MKVYVFGLGHIGLPMSTWIALNNYTVYGIDTNEQHIENITKGKVQIEEKYEDMHISDLSKKLISEGKLFVNSRYCRQDNKPSIFIVAVGIKDTLFGHDISPILDVVNNILPTSVDGDLIIFRTTMIPGTIDNHIIPLIKKLKKTIHIAYSPETIIETKAYDELKRNNRILSANTKIGYKKAFDFLKSLAPAGIYKSSNIKTAETVKVIQNIVRDVEIALINEISNICKELEIDTYELRNLANTHPRINLLLPGPGVGGYCIPNALKYLQGSLKEPENYTLVNTARDLNSMQPSMIVDKIDKILQSHKKSIKNSKISVLGLAMKDLCSDIRFSPALEIVDFLVEKGATVMAFDPLVSNASPHQVASMTECLIDSDLVLITAHQSSFQYNLDFIKNCINKPYIVFDTRNVFPKNNDIQLYTL